MIKTSDYLKTLLPAAAIVAFALCSDFGFTVFSLIPILLIWLVINAVQMIRRPQERRLRALRMAIWIAAFVTIVGVLGHWSNRARSEADAAIHAVMAYKAKNGSYPQTLAEIGIDDAALHDRWGIRYLIDKDGPALVYPSPLMPLEGYEYDFVKARWITHSY